MFMLYQHEDKMNMQQQVVTEMKNFLKPYYMKRQITKDEYKEIMRQAVPRVYFFFWLIIFLKTFVACSIKLNTCNFQAYVFQPS